MTYSKLSLITSVVFALALVLVITSIYQDYSRSMHNKVVPSTVTTTSIPSIYPTSIPPIIPTPQVISNWKKYTLEKLTDSYFTTFTITNPSNWVLSYNLYDNNSQEVILSKNDHKIFISQFLSDVGLCVFEDTKLDSDNPEINNNDYIRNFKEINGNFIFRYFQYESTESETMFNLCQKQPNEKRFSAATDLGFIRFETPKIQNLTILAEMEQIIKSITPLN